MNRLASWLGDSPTAWFLLLLTAFMGTALLIGFSCSPVTPAAPSPTTYGPWVPQTSGEPIEVEEP